MAYTYEREAIKALYKLKRMYGIEVIFYRNLESTPNYETGIFSYTTENITVSRAILFPVTYDQKFSYDLTFLAANKNFQMGALYTVGIRYLIVDSNDMDFDATLQNYCTLHNERYEIIKIDDFYPSVAKILRLQVTEGRT